MTVLALTLGAPGLKDPPAKADLLVGVWSLESVAYGGKVRPSSDHLCWEFTADGKYTDDTNQPYKGSYSVDPKARPRAIDFKRLRDPAIEGIYKVEDDKLTIALPNNERTLRPTDFETPKDNEVWVLVFKRVKPKD